MGGVWGGWGGGEGGRRGFGLVCSFVLMICRDGAEERDVVCTVCVCMCVCVRGELGEK